MGYGGIRRIARRCGEELRATCEIARLTSWPEAANTFRAKLDIQAMNRNGFQEPTEVRDRLLRKHATVMNYLEARYGEWADSYDYSAVKVANGASPLSGKVWVCWWQGLERAPELVCSCVKSIEAHAGDHEVVVITDDNLADYVEFPGWLMDKHRAGVVTRTNLSDLLRLSLLAEYGGLWLDSTFLCVRDLEEIVFSTPFFSIKRPDYGHCSVACGYFAGYSYACDDDMRWMFRVFKDFFLHYWETNDFMVDYLLVDYVVAFVQSHCPEIAEAFAAIEPNNPRCDDLFCMLGEPYDETTWEALQAETSLFKLSWKHGFPTERDGRDTFYGKVLKGELV